MLVLEVSEATATEGVILASIVIPLVLLAVVGSFFWRAAKRDREANR